MLVLDTMQQTPTAKEVDARRWWKGAGQGWLFAADMAAVKARLDRLTQ